MHGGQAELATELLQYHASHERLGLGKFALDGGTDVTPQGIGDAFQQLVGIHGGVLVKLLADGQWPRVIGVKVLACSRSLNF